MTAEDLYTYKMVYQKIFDLSRRWLLIIRPGYSPDKVYIHGDRIDFTTKKLENGNWVHESLPESIHVSYIFDSSTLEEDAQEAKERRFYL